MSGQEYVIALFIFEADALTRTVFSGGDLFILKSLWRRGREAWRVKSQVFHARIFYDWQKL